MAHTKAIVIQVRPDDRLSTDMAPLAESARQYAEQSVAKATRRGYSSDWKGFETWCKKRRLVAFPAEPQTVALYFTDLANSGRSHKTISRIQAAISWLHSHHKGEDGKYLMSPTRDPVVKAVLRGIANTVGRASRRRKAAATIEDVLEPMVKGLPDDVRGHRDRAVLLLGFSGAFRRSELAGLRLEDIEIRGDGAIVRLRRSKTDQTGEGSDVAIPRGSNPELCPVAAMQVWLEDLRRMGIVEGHFVRGIHRSGNVLVGSGNTDKTINRIVKSAAERAGIDSDTLGAHSLRAGFATQAAVRGKSVLQIAAQGRWKKMDTVLGYFRAGTSFKNSGAKDIGL
jgi:site-specific recombinase XerD